MSIIEHAYIIYIENEHSIEYANRCAETCTQHGLPYTLFKGSQNVAGKANLEADTGFTWNVGDNYSAEFNCTASHLRLWRVVAEQPHACAIFEHDAVLKRSLDDCDIPDDKLVMLGLRILNEDDYTCGDEPYVIRDITKFEGTHAYAITPVMAQYMIDRMNGHYTQSFGGVNTTIDGIISIQDCFGIQRAIVDPPPAAAVVGNRKSTCQSAPATYNAIEAVFDGFKRGLTPVAAESLIAR